jgi:carboxylate-amine ligase
VRHGHVADLLDRGLDRSVPLGEVVDREASRLGVSRIRDVYDRESGAGRQRRLREEAGPDALCEDLIVDPE